MSQLDRKMIEEAGWVLSDSAWKGMSSYEKSFFVAEFTGLKTLDYYRQRLVNIGFEGHARVLDAACGMGQWSIALSQLNNFVEGIDLSYERLRIAKLMAAGLNMHNCFFSYGSIESLPYKESSFDAILCYGAFMFTDMPKTLREFSRILKKGGLVYINANSIGWYAHLLIDRGIRGKNRAMFPIVLGYLKRTVMRRESQIVVGRSSINRLLASCGFEVVACGCEGEVCLVNENKAHKPKPAYPARYYMMPSMVEVVAAKRKHP